jgi:hypothetical protein
MQSLSSSARLNQTDGAANNARRNANDKGEQRYQQCGADTYLGHSGRTGECTTALVARQI